MRKKCYEILKDNYPVKKIAGKIIKVLNQPEFYEYRQDYCNKNGYDADKILSMAKGLKLDLYNKIKDYETSKDNKGILNCNGYIHIAIRNFFLDEFQLLNEKHNLTINQKLTEELRRMSGIPDLEINIKYEKEIKSIPGYEHCKIKENSVEVYYKDTIAAYFQKMTTIENLYGSLNPSDTLFEITNNPNPEELVIKKEIFEKLLTSLSFEEFNIYREIIHTPRNMQQIAERNGRSINYVRKKLHDVYKKLRVFFDE